MFADSVKTFLTIGNRQPSISQSISTFRAYRLYDMTKCEGRLFGRRMKNNTAGIYGSTPSVLLSAPLTCFLILILVNF